LKVAGVQKHLLAPEALAIFKWGGGKSEHPPILFAAGEDKIERPPKLYAEVDPPSFFELWWVLDFVISLCSNEIGKSSG